MRSRVVDEFISYDGRGVTLMFYAAIHQRTEHKYGMVIVMLKFASSPAKISLKFNFSLKLDYVGYVMNIVWV